MAKKVDASFLYDLHSYYGRIGHDPFDAHKQMQAKRMGGHEYLLSDHVEAMIKALLSNQRPWQYIDKRLDDIEAIFFRYDIEKIKETPGEYFEIQLRKIKCGNRQIKKQMAALHENIHTMEQVATEYGSLDAFVTSKPAENIVRLFTTKYKLRQMGNALTWEYLRNIGIDGAKPDKHLRLFLGRLGFSRNSPAPATVEEVLEIVNKLHELSNWELAKIDAYIWNFCADGYAEICSEKPKCYKCPVRIYCNFTV